MASIIGTPGFFDLGQTTTPGAQSVTVPSDATHVAIFFYLSDDASTPNATVSTLTSDFAGTFTINNSSSTTVAMGGSVCTAAVTSTGAGKTFTPTFASVNTVAEAGAWCVFLKEVSPTWPTGVATAHATGTGTTAGTATATGAAGGLAIAVDSRLNATSGTYPANETGWTSVATGQTGPGGLTYYANSRIRTLAISADGNVSATTQNANGSVVSILTIESWRVASGALAGPAGTVTGSATHYTKHTASGVLAGPSGVVEGTAAHYTLHSASGDLVGPAGVVEGVASRWHAFSASGELSGPSGVIEGTAAHYTLHTASGDLVGPAGVVEGSATLTTGGEHSASGVLSGPSGVIEGTATHYTLHTASGELIGPAGVISSNAAHYTLHTASGELVGPAGVISGASVHSGPGATVVQGGGGGAQKKRKKLAVLEIDGKEYVIPAEDVQSFLNSLVKPDKKKAKKPEAKKEVPAIAPAVRIVEVAPEIERVVVQKVDRTNELLLAAWNRAIERELEEEEELIWLMVA